MRDEIWRLKGEGVVARSEDHSGMVARTEDPIARDVMLLSMQEELKKKKNAEMLLSM